MGKARLLEERLAFSDYETYESTKQTPRPTRALEDVVLKSQRAILSRRVPWVEACQNMAQVLGWPKLKIRPHQTILGGQAMWRLYLTSAPVVDLINCVHPLLYERVLEIPLPVED